MAVGIAVSVSVGVGVVTCVGIAMGVSVGVGVSDAVAVGVDVFVGVLVAGGASYSYAPMSQALPWGRATPRWSVASGTSLWSGQLLIPSSMALLPDSKAWVNVGPPLSARLVSKLVTAAVLMPEHSAVAKSSNRLLLPVPAYSGENDH